MNGGSERLSEEEFVEQYEKDYSVRYIARECYREMYPTGMHTNGPTRVRLEVSNVLRVLSKWRQ